MSTPVSATIPSTANSAAATMWIARTGSFPAAFAACAGFEVVALAIACFTRESGGRTATASGF